jgi:type I restriction enzyme M protein
MFESAFKNIDDTLWKDAGCSSELDYIEQTSWVLFLKYLDDYETDKETAAKLNGTKYQRIVDGDYRWTKWAAPKRADGSLDYNQALTGDDLREFVNQRLFPHLARFKQEADGPKTIQYKIGEIFSELRNKLQSGYALRDVINKVDELRFLSNEDKHELSSLYEDKIKNMGNAGRNGGEYYTPRPLIKSIVKVIDPKIGETVYDGAAGSGGFLCEAYEYMRTSRELSAADYETLQTRTFYGKEKKSLAYVIGIMNMILHGVEAPNIVHTNTLAENLADIQQRDRVDVVLANPPFGGKERAEIQQNFPIKTSETAYLFLQHFIKILKGGGRCGVIVKDTFLSNGDAKALRKQLLNECNLHAVLGLPKVFGTTGQETVVLFFVKGQPTTDIWCYQLSLDRNIGVTQPLSDIDLQDFERSYVSKATTDRSWVVSIDEIDKTSWNLRCCNPTKDKNVGSISSAEIIQELADINSELTNILEEIKEIST